MIRIGNKAIRRSVTWAIDLVTVAGSGAPTGFFSRGGQIWGSGDESHWGIGMEPRLLSVLL